jgi:hypothetical protein
LSQDLSPDLEAALAEQGALADPATGLVHLGNGRWYDPALGRPLQPNPAGGPPTLPQALNRYAATPLGQPGVAQGASSSGVDLLSPIAWTALTANIGLEVAGRTVVAQSGRLVLQGTAPALEKSLAGKGLPFGVSSGFTKGGPLGDFSVGLAGLFSARLQRKLADRLFVFEASTQGNIGILEKLKNGQFSFRRFGTTVETGGLEVVSYQRGLLLAEARVLRTLSSVGLTAVIDVGFELYELGTNTGQWGNPYLTTRQKRVQAFLVIGSDLALAGTLAFYGVAWEVAIPTTFLWAILADPILSQLPGTSQFYEENRNLQPLELLSN